MKYFSYIIIAIIAISVVAGFFIVGSPKEERLMRLDDQRIQDLQNIQWQIINYWQNKKRLPEKLTDLIDNISGFYPPLDPETKQDYTYQVTGSESFTLCANFSRPSTSRTLYFPEPELATPPTREVVTKRDNWQHEIGMFCFDRTIDKDLYKLKNKE